MLTHDDTVEMRRIHMRLTEEVEKARQMLRKASDSQMCLGASALSLRLLGEHVDDVLRAVIDSIDEVAENEP